MGQYDKKGSYAGYKKNNKEREALDYYATPVEEVRNILYNKIEISPKLLENNSRENRIQILEPCAGGGHMVQGIIDWCEKEQIYVTIYCTDIKDRELSNYIRINKYIKIVSNLDQDFLSDEYCHIDKEFDFIIMNPPFSTIEPFVLRALELLKDDGQLIMFARTKFLESQSRFENIFKNDPPNQFYQYVERVACYINGDFSVKPNSIESYAWFIWNRENSLAHEFDFIHRASDDLKNARDYNG